MFCHFMYILNTCRIWPKERKYFWYFNIKRYIYINIHFLLYKSFIMLPLLIQDAVLLPIYQMVMYNCMIICTLSTRNIRAIKDISWREKRAEYVSMTENGREALQLVVLRRIPAWTVVMPLFYVQKSKSKILVHP